MTTTTKIALPLLTLAAAGGILVAVGDEQLVEVPPPEYHLSGTNLAAAAGCAEQLGCTTDVWALAEDGGVVRLVLRREEEGLLDVGTGRAFELRLDGGVADLFPDGGAE